MGEKHLYKSFCAHSVGIATSGLHELPRFKCIIKGTESRGIGNVGDR